MDTLYIVGNGFDMAHSMPVCYACFKSYLSENNGNREECKLCSRNMSSTCGQGRNCYMYTLIQSVATSNEWNNFGHDLANINFKSIDIKTIPLVSTI